MEPCVWKEIEGFPGYEINRKGDIMSFMHKKAKLRKQKIGKTGYWECPLSDSVGNSRKTQFVHRLVAKTFIPNPENKPFVNHINGVKLDNRVENLEWVTHQENVDHAIRTNLFQWSGQDNNAATLNNKQVEEICNRLYKSVYTYAYISSLYDTYPDLISAINVFAHWNSVSSSFMKDKGLEKLLKVGYPIRTIGFSTPELIVVCNASLKSSNFREFKEVLPQYKEGKLYNFYRKTLPKIINSWQERNLIKNSEYIYTNEVLKEFNHV